MATCRREWAQSGHTTKAESLGSRLIIHYFYAADGTGRRSLPLNFDPKNVEVLVAALKTRETNNKKTGLMALGFMAIAIGSLVGLFTCW